ncbi:MAG: hypothetical protein L3J47_07505 [Sulfurovum sp.]|nr:hypothetical protein [Sulfurovum sp.]
MSKQYRSLFVGYERLLQIGTFVLLFMLFISLFFWVKHVNEGKLISASDRIITEFRSGLDYEMANLLSFSLALAEDGELKNALIEDDETKGYEILSNITQRFKKYTHLKTLRIQLITPELFIFARSWDEGFEGMPLWWFRDDLNILKKKSEPKVGVETGRLLTFKATVPIRSGKRLLGYLEVITLLDELAKKLHRKGIELFVMMDEKYLDKAELMRDFPRVDRYVVSNQNYNYILLNDIKNLDWKALISEDYIYDKDTLFLSEPMYNGEGKQIGHYIFAIGEEIVTRYTEPDSRFSLVSQFSDEDIEKVVDVWRRSGESYRTIEDKELVGVLPKLRKEDKADLEKKAKALLRGYSKEELINIILSNKHEEKKNGVIK